jgi:hypothetical protein
LAAHDADARTARRRLSQAVPPTSQTAQFSANSPLRGWHVVCSLRTQMMESKHGAAGVSSFVVIASAATLAACSGSFVNADPGGSAAGGPAPGDTAVSGSGGAAGWYSVAGGPPGGYGGYFEGPGGYGGTYDVNPPLTQLACPLDLPSDDSPCALEQGVCEYLSSCTSIFATCASGHWQIATNDWTCAGGAGGADDTPSKPPPSGPLACPTVAPISGSLCNLPSTFVSYTCDIPDPPGSCGGTKATCSSAGMWEVTSVYGCAGDSGI